MATGNTVLDKGYRASAAVTKFRAVKFTGVETVGPIAAIGDEVAGFAQFSVSAGELAKGKGASVRVEGITEVEVNAAIAIGVRCFLNADGTVGAAGAGKRHVGKCVGHAATATGQRISMLIEQHGLAT